MTPLLRFKALAIPRRRRHRAPPQAVGARLPLVELNEHAITRQIVEVLRVAGYQVHETGRERWHERVSVDYGNGYCLTSPCAAFDQLMRQLEQAREAS